MIELFSPVLALIAALVFIHSLFGFEIIKRGIIFTDLAIGQAAALGVALSLVWLDSSYSYGISLLMAMAAALFIAHLSNKPHKEASIGLIYALGFSAIFLVMSNSAKGMELFLELTASDILFTSFDAIVKSILFYSIIAMFYYFLVYRQKNPKIKEASFFILFALTVTNSVQVAGVFVVFVLLIVPAYLALLFQKKLLFANVCGTTLSFLAILVSFSFDLPTGYTIIAFLSFTALTVISIKKE